MEKIEKIEKIVEILGVSSLEVKRILEIPIKECFALSAEKAREIFFSTKDEEESYSAAIRWMWLTTSFEDANELYQNSERNCPEEALAIRTMLRLSANFEQANHVRGCVLEIDEDYMDDYSGLYEQSLEKTILLCGCASEGRELWEDCGEEEYEGKYEEKIFHTWLNLCQSRDEYEDILSEFSDENNPDAVTKAEIINTEWRTRFATKNDQVHNKESCAEAYLEAPNDKSLVKALITKWLSFCESETDVIEVFKEVSQEDYQISQEEFVKKLYQVI